MTWITNAKLVLPDQTLERASLRLEGGLIAEIREGDVLGGINARGLTLIAGLVDLHGDMHELFLEPRPGAEFPLELALNELDARFAACGVTTAFVSITFDRGKAVREGAFAARLVEFIRSGRWATDLKIHLRYEIPALENAPLVQDLLERGFVDLLSLMDHSPGQGQFRSFEAHAEYVAARQNLTLEGAHAHLALNRRVEGALEGWPAASQIAREAVARGVPLASHDDDTPEKVARMLELGATVSEFPVTLEAALEAKKHGLQVVMGAPNALRRGSHRGNLSALEVLSNGALNALAADYSPMALLAAPFQLARDGALKLHEALNLGSRNPARIVGLTDRGTLEVGQRADLVLLDLLLVGETPHPRVRLTLNLGRVVYSDGSLSGLDTLALSSRQEVLP